MRTCIFTIIKNEHEYIQEFIEYHLNLGIDFIFIFEDIDSESHKDIICEYPSERVKLMNIVDIYEDKDDIISMKKSRLFTMQKRYIKKILHYIKDNYDFDWVFVIDIDEYITLQYNRPLKEVLNKFNDYEAVVLQWENYGANNLVFKPDYSKKGIIDTYTKKAGYQYNDRPFSLTKTVYNMNLYNYEDAKNLHIEYDLTMKWCKSDFSQDTENKIYDNIYLRHYITKSWEEYVWKIYVRGMFYPLHRKYDNFFEINEDMKDRKEELMILADSIIEKYKS